MTDAKEYLRSKAEPVEFPGADFTTTAVPLYLAEEALGMLRKQIAQELHDWAALHAGPDGAFFADLWERRIARGEQR